jgi:fibronectin-binding autotransporter adhesin
MKKQLHKLLLISFCLSVTFSLHSYGQRKVEKLGRGVVAINRGGGKVYISWRFLVQDPEDIGFNIYRSVGGATAEKLNTSLITTSTDFTDNTASITTTNTYFVRPVIDNVEQAPSKSFMLMGSNTGKSYISIPLQPLPHYSVQHIYPGDIDGDGEYDYIVKRLPVDSHNNVMLEAYKNDGTFIWRIDLGPNIEQGAPTHNPFVLVYDFDGDGKAEVLTRSSEGTIFADGSVIPDTNGDGISDYRTFPAVSLGYMLLGDNCPEYLSMVDGMTGKEITRTDWLYRGRKSEWLTKWGDDYGHRMSMQFIGVAFLDGIHPSIVGSRGPGELMDVAAWRYANKQFTTQWTWSSRNNPAIPSGYHWADFHNIRIADLDGDGKDEISFGVNAMDDNGTPLYYAKDDIGHGDRFVITDLDPDRPGLECYAIQQATSVLAVLYDAKNGERLKTWSSSAPFDVSRGDAADIDSSYKGCELWSYAHSTLLDCKGNAIPGATSFPHPALSVWWDGDLLRENLDAADGNGYNPIINKWNPATNSQTRLLSLYNEGGSYSTKSPYAGRVALYGDIMGDWREEIFCMNSDSTEIRIFSTWTPTNKRIYCLMQNPEYRACIGPKGYLPSTEVDYYLGVGMTTPPTPPVLTAKNIWSGGLNGNAWDVNTSANWKHNEAANLYAEGDTVMFDLSGAENTAVTLNSEINPGFVIVNSPVNYSIAGTGSITGTTRLLKSGKGALTLSAKADYSGKTKIEQGYVYVNSSLSLSSAYVYKDAGIGGSGTIAQPVTLEKGAMIIPGTEGSVGTLTFSSGLNLPGKNTFLFDMTDDSTGQIKPGDIITVTGNITFADTNYFVIHKINDKVKPGTYPLIKYTGTFTGNLTHIIVSGLSGQKCNLTNSGGVISLTVFASRSPETIVWSGTGAKWDLMSSANWLKDETAEVFVTGDSVVFNSTGSGQYNVNVTENVSMGSMTVDASMNDYSFTGPGAIGGKGGLSKTGSGTLTIDNANTFTGKVAITGGSLQVNKLANAGSPGPIGASTDTIPSSILFSDAKLTFTGTGSSTTSDRGMTLNGSDTIEIANSSSSQLILTGRLTGTGKLIKTGPGILLLQPSGRNSFSGGTLIQRGTVSFGSTLSNVYGFGSGPVTLDGGIWSMYNNTSGTDYNSPWNLVVNTTGGISAASRGTLSGSLTGNGILTLYIPYVRTWLSGNWSAFTGTVNVTTDADGGLLRLGKTNYANMGFYLNAGITASYVASNGSADATATVSIGELSGAPGSFLYNDNWVIGTKNTDATFAGTISGNSVTKTGTGSWMLTGANTYAGATTINGGILYVNNTTGSGTGTGVVTVNNTGTLAGNGSIAGSVTVAAGGIIAPGKEGTGTLNIKNNVSLLSGSITTMEINKSSLTSDTLRISGTLRYNGTLSISNTGSVPFATGDHVHLFIASGYSGSFSAITPAIPGEGLQWDTTELRVNGSIHIMGDQSITFGPLTSQTYGNVSFALTATASSGLPVTYSVSNDSVIHISGNEATIAGTGTVIVTASQTGNADYFPAIEVSQTLQVNPASQSISFEVIPPKTYGDAPFELSATGGESGNAITFMSSSADIAVISGHTVSITGAGTCNITASQAANRNYKAATDVSQILEVGKADQTIRFTDLTIKKVGDAPFDLAAVSSSGLPVTFTSSDTKVASVNGATVTVLSAGTTLITAQQSGNSNYNAAPAEVRTLDVIPRFSLCFVNHGITIFPNPVKDYIIVLFQELPFNTPIKIFALNGNMLFSKEVSEERTVIDVNSFRRGLYVIKVSSPKGTFTCPFIKL